MTRAGMTRSQMMARVRSKDTKPEMAVRRACHALGLRFRLHRRDLPGSPDLIFPRWNVALFVHGCFWHRHAHCSRASTPASNVEFWRTKFRRNERRDQAAVKALGQLGWQVHVVWECEASKSEVLKGKLANAFPGWVAKAGCGAADLTSPLQALDKQYPNGRDHEKQPRGVQCAEGEPLGGSLRDGRDGPPLNCVDLFAGAGGFSLAAQEAGLAVRLAVEHNKHAAATYRRNICEGESPPRLIEDDIKTLIPNKLSAELFSDGTACDVLLGGPPCQGFSTHRLNDAGVADTRNDLIHVYFDFVKAFSPKLFLMENVPGMLWRRHEEALKRFYAEGKEAGYCVLDPVIVDARDYGLPQRRKRVFILGLSEALGDRQFDWPPAPTHGSEVVRRSNPDLLPWRSCATAFEPVEGDDVNDVHMMHSQVLIDAFARTPANGGSRQDSGRMLECHRDHDGHKDVYGRIDPSKPAPTMTTACINPSKGRFVHPTLNHGITVRQAARIQTFPDTFVLEGGLMAAGEQVGNAVPVALGKHLIQHLLPLLENRPSAPDNVSKRVSRALALA